VEIGRKILGDLTVPRFSQPKLNSCQRPIAGIDGSRACLRWLAPSPDRDCLRHFRRLQEKRRFDQEGVDYRARRFAKAEILVTDSEPDRRAGTQKRISCCATAGVQILTDSEKGDGTDAPLTDGLAPAPRKRAATARRRPTGSTQRQVEDIATASPMIRGLRDVRLDEVILPFRVATVGCFARVLDIPIGSAAFF